MSAISRELQEQQGNLGPVMRKLFPDAPKISEEEANRLRDEERKKLADERAKAILAHVRELGDDY